MEKIAFGKQLKNLRKTAGITQEEFAEKLNVHAQTISKWERGVTEPDISLLGEIAEILGVSIERLVGIEEAKVYKGLFNAQSLGKKINNLRRMVGESQKELAAIMQVLPDTISKWERGKICPSIDLLANIAAHYNVSLSELYFAVPADGVQPTPKIPERQRRYLKWIITATCLFLSAVIALGAYFIFGYHRHSFGEWEIVIAVTCLEDGEEVRRCSGCNETESRLVPATGHNIITIHGTPNGCLTSGFTDGRVCENCGKVYAAQLYIPPLGHMVSDWVIIKEPTTTEEGLKEKRCLTCDKLLRQEPIPTLLDN